MLLEADRAKFPSFINFSCLKIQGKFCHCDILDNKHPHNKPAHRLFRQYICSTATNDKMTEKEGNLPPFVIKTFRLMSDATVHPYANWGDDGKSFTVYNPSEFASTVLPKYFKHNNFCSFVR
jgi:hypothetical protein